MGAQGAGQAPTDPAEWELQLLGGWRLRRAGADILVGAREQRLIALLALDGARPRSHLAGTLWPRSSERRARGNLRDTLWHLNQVAPGLLVQDATVELTPELVLDVAAFHRCRAAIAADPRAVEPETALPLLSGATLLPGWYEDWVLFEQERIDQLRLRALEALAEGLTGIDNDAALAAAMAAVHLAPLRDRAQHALLRVHLADGNSVEAMRLYRSFSERLQTELGLDPSPAVVDLVATAPHLRRFDGRPRGGPRATDTAPCPSFEAASHAVVRHLAEVFDVQLWLTTRTAHEWQHVVATAGRINRPPSELAWAEACCTQLAAGRSPSLVSTAAGLPVALRASVVAYLGVRLRHSDGTVAGTLCGFAGSDPARRLTAARRDVRIFGRLLSTLLAHDRVPADLAPAYVPS